QPPLSEQAQTLFLLTGDKKHLPKEGNHHRFIHLRQHLITLVKAGHWGLFAGNSFPLLVLEKGIRKRRLVLDNIKPLTGSDCPYADYLLGLLLLDKPDEKQKTTAAQCLVQAACAGATGAALELISQSLIDDTFPIPASAAMALLKSCVERPDNRQLPLRIHSQMQSPPFHSGEQIIALLEQHLHTPMAPYQWVELGHQLSLFSQKTQDKRERCLLLAACAYSAGQDTASAMKCRISRKKTDALPCIPAFDWFIMNLPDSLQHPPALLTSWLPATLLQNILTKDDNGLTKTLEELKHAARQDKFQWFQWLLWLPYCLPDDTDLSWIQGKGKFKSYCQHLLAVRSLSVGPLTAVSAECQPEQVRPTLPLRPLKADDLNAQLEKEYPDSVVKVANEFQDIALYLTDALRLLSSGGDQPDQPVSVVKLGCQLTAEALHLMGAEVNISDRVIFFPPGYHDISTENRAKALSLLQKAIEHHANPYACWIYGRMIRAQLLPGLATEQGEREWYEQYLSIMVFAAQIGIEGAANDLLAEALTGRADALLTVIATFIGCRFIKPRRFFLDIAFPPLVQNEFLKRLTSAKKINNNKDWCRHIISNLGVVIDEAILSKDINHKLRICWLHALLHRRCPDSDKVSLALTMPQELAGLEIPMALQVSIITALEYFGPPVRKYYDDVLSPHVHPSVAMLKSNLSDRGADAAGAGLTPSPEECVKLLSYLQWQLGSDQVIFLGEQLKKSISPKNTYVRDRIIPHQQLLRFVHLTVLSDAYDTLPECRESCIADLVHWFTMYQALSSAKDISLFTPSTDLKDQRQIILETDQRFVASLRRERDSRSPLVELLNILKAVFIRPDTLMVVPLCEPYTARNLLRQLQSLPPERSIDPYYCLVKGLCLEHRMGECTSEFDLAQAGVEYINSAMLGSDCAVHHLARLALSQTNSPIALERVLDMFLLQSQRSQRHTVYIHTPADVVVTPGQQSIINALTSATQSTGQSVSDIIKNRLIPALERLREGTRFTKSYSPEIGLLLSYCHQKLGINQSCTLFPADYLSSMSASMLHQWQSHLSSLSWGSEEDKVRYKKQQELLNLALKKSKTAYRMTPYFIRASAHQTKEWDKFEQWHRREGSWHELPVMMGQTELTKWQNKNAGTVIPRYQDNTLILYHTPGDSLSENYQITLHRLFIDALLTGGYLRIPVTSNPDELALAQYWYDRFRIEIDDISLAGTITAQPSTAGKKKKRKKTAVSSEAGPC
ncbi:hypothetical protein, partial [Sansalvadorimonas verongulae]|uniref:hypothetical protein n=1 Tax=Sansalvadorimonas verongulae TaxID=2172824 RepID=UPI001E50F9A7